VTLDVAASSIIQFTDTFDMGKTGQYWAPRGPRYVACNDPRRNLSVPSDIGTAEQTLGPKDELLTPLRLPW